MNEFIFSLFFTVALSYVCAHTRDKNCRKAVACSSTFNQQEAAVSSMSFALVSPWGFRQTQDYQEWFSLPLSVTHTHAHTPSQHNNWVNRPNMLWSFSSSASTFTHNTCYNVGGSSTPFLQNLHASLTNRSPTQHHQKLHLTETSFPTQPLLPLPLPLLCKAVVPPCFPFVYCTVCVRMCSCVYECTLCTDDVWAQAPGILLQEIYGHCQGNSI